MIVQILRRKQVEQTIGLSRSTIYYMMSNGEFPRPIKLGARSVGWNKADVEKWLGDRMGQSAQ